MTTRTVPRQIDMVSATPAREHLELLRQTMHWQHMIKATGCASETLYRIYHGKRTEIRAETETKILNTQPTVDLAHLVDATGTKRRIRALQAIGHTYIDIADAGGGSVRGLQKLSTDDTRATTKREFAEQIKAAYEVLSHTPAAASRHATLVRNIAAERNWDGPEAWEGVDIDDPDAQPRNLKPNAEPRTPSQGTPLASSKPRAAGGNWRHYAACRDQDPELFFPIGETGPAQMQTAEAKAICGACGVKNLCLQWALETGQDSGIWGGFSEDERRAIKRRAARNNPNRKRLRIPAECGTRSGYKRHQREHTAICQPCRDANTAYGRKLHGRDQVAEAA